MSTSSNIPVTNGDGSSKVATYTITEDAVTKHLGRQVLVDSAGAEIAVATSTKQDTANTSLASIDGKITAVNTGAVVISSSALPSGASTSAKQDTGNTSLASIDGKITAVNTGAVVISSGSVTANAGTNLNTSLLALEGGGNLAAIAASLSVMDDWDESDRAKVNPIVGQAGVAAGAGAVSATTQRVVLANDDYKNSMFTVESSLQSIAAKYVDSSPATVNVTTIDSGSSSTTGANQQNIITGTPSANSAATFTLSGQNTIRVQVTGTWTGTLSSEISIDGGTTYVAVGLHQGGFTTSTFTANFIGGANVSGATHYRVRATAAMTGTAVVKVVESINDQSVYIANAGPAGTVVSTNNSSTATLTSGSVFTGTGEDVSNFSEMRVSVIASHASATDGLSIQQSSDNSNWDITDTYTIAATTGKTFVVPRQAKYFRVVYTNGGTNQTSFRLQSILNRTATSSSSQRSQDAYSNENDLEQVWAFNSVWNGATWDRTPGSTAGVKVLEQSTHVQADDAAFTPGTSKVSMSGYEADETATDSVDEGDGGAARMTLDRKQIVTLQPHTQGGLTTYHLASAGSTNATVVKASAGQLYGYMISNTTAAYTYLVFHNASSTPTAGASVFFKIGIPANGAANVSFPQGIAFSTGISITTVTGAADSNSTAVAANDQIINLWYA